MRPPSGRPSSPTFIAFPDRCGDKCEGRCRERLTEGGLSSASDATNDEDCLRERGTSPINDSERQQDQPGEQSPSCQETATAPGSPSSHAPGGLENQQSPEE